MNKVFDLQKYILTIFKDYPRHGVKFQQKVKFNKKIHNLLQKNTQTDYIKFRFINNIFYLPNISFGAITSKNLFEYDEIVIFLFYLTNSFKFKRVIDIGANIGLHSLILSSLGIKVKSYEPDPITFKNLSKTIKRNKCQNIQIVNKAVSNKNGKVYFNRIKNNLTGSHILGMKEKVYGPIDKFKVNCVNINSIIKNHDLIKIDAEGAESDIICSLRKDHLKDINIIFEINNFENKQKIYNFASKYRLNLYSQKTNWKRVSKLKDLPDNYKDGSVFLSKKELPFTI